jgi:hypothetical protein
MEPGKRTWDPGGDQNLERKLFKITIPTQVYSLLATIMATDVDLVLDDADMKAEQSRTKLDLHANMPVVGRHVFIISDTGRIADVNPFTPDYEPMQLPIVDAAVQYDCRYNGRSYILVIRNALHVPSMKNNLLPPFVMREAGLKVYDIPKIQVTEPSIEDHSLSFPETGFRVPLSLWGMFSYFSTTKPTATLMMETEDIYLLTPSRWNPHDDSYATNEENMLNWEGNMKMKKDRVVGDSQRHSRRGLRTDTGRREQSNRYTSSEEPHHLRGESPALLATHTTSR